MKERYFLKIYIDFRIKKWKQFGIEEGKVGSYSDFQCKDALIINGKWREIEDI